MKKIKLLLVSLTTLSLMACNPGDEGSSQSDINSNPTSDSLTENDTSNEVSSEDSSEEESSEEETPLPKTLDEVVALVNASLDKSITSLSFKDIASLGRYGIVKIANDGVLEEGMRDLDDLNVEYMLYHGYDSEYYYAIEPDSSKPADKFKIVESVTDSNLEKTLDEAKTEMQNNINYDLAWFVEGARDSYSLKSVVPGVNPLPDKDNQMEIVRDKDGGFTFTYDALSNSISVVATYHTVYKFDSENNLVSGSFYYNTWNSKNFDSDINKLIDANQKPASQTGREISNIVYGSVENLDFDKSSYYISELGDVSISSSYYNSSSHNKNEVEVGKQLQININNFLPATAIDSSMFKILSSDNENVIRKTQYIDTFEVIDEGTTNLVVGDKFGLITKTIEVTAIYPPVVSFGFKALSEEQKTIQVEDSLEIGMSIMPTGANHAFTVELSEDSIVSYKISEDYSALTITGLNPGKVTVTAISSSDSSKTASVDLTIVERVDVSFLVGTHSRIDTVDFDGVEVDVTSVLKLNADKTGSLKMSGVWSANPTNRLYMVSSYATFKWNYDGSAFVISNWKSSFSDEDDFAAISKDYESERVNDEKTQLSIGVSTENFSGDRFKLTLIFDLA